MTHITLSFLLEDGCRHLLTALGKVHVGLGNAQPCQGHCLQSSSGTAKLDVGQENETPTPRALSGELQWLH